MVRLIEHLYAPERLSDWEPLVVDFLRLADDAGDSPEPAGHTHRADICERRQPAIEHARIELVRLAVYIHVTAWEVGSHQRVPAFHHPGQQIVDERILGAPQGRELKAGGLQEGGRINPSAVRRVEYDRGPAGARLEHLEWW